MSRMPRHVRPSESTVSRRDAAVPLSGERFLRPGEHYCGQDDLWVTTLLGSCVSVVLWDPLNRLGAMCHFMLARRRLHRVVAMTHSHSDGLYGQEALRWMESALTARGCPVGRCEAQVFGGARIGSLASAAAGIGEDNVRLAVAWLDEHQVHLRRADVGGAQARRIAFHPLRGECHLSYASPAAARREIQP